MNQTTKNSGLNVGIKSYLTAIFMILTLMVLTYLLTLFVPGGHYARTIDAAGNSIIDPNGAFAYMAGGIPFWKWLLSPVLALGADGGGMIIAILAFLVVIGGIFTCLQDCGLMNYMLGTIVSKFGKNRYQLLSVITLFFMTMGAAIGSFEECIPLVPIVTQLAVGLGWDVMTGLCMSLLAVGCGFASGLCNPFTVGIAQNLSGLPMYSGIWLRALAFILIYGLLMAFILHHAKAIDTKIVTSHYTYHRDDPRKSKALLWFVSILGVGMVLIFSSSFITFLQDYTIVIVALMFLIGGLTSAILSGISRKRIVQSFCKGAVGIFPAVVLILMASSIKYTLSEANILDTLLYWSIQGMEYLPKWAIVLAIYFLVLGLNFFISSGSAKAFLLIPLMVPITAHFGINSQLSILAFAFGDGFSNVFYPTNAALLIALSLTGTSYGTWAKFTWKFQAVNLVLTSLLLLFGLAVGYC